MKGEIEMAYFCSKCGAPLEENAKFCGSCGTKLEAVEPQQTPVMHNDSVDHIKKEFDVVKNNVAERLQNVSNAEWQKKVESDSFVQRFKGRYLTTQGRLNRWAYFVAGIKLFLMALIPYIMLGIGAVMLEADSGAANILGLFFLLPSLVLVLPFIAASLMLQIRRCHDLGHSGWIILIGLIPYVNILFYLYIIFCPGTKGANQYGEDPLQQVSYQ